LKKVNNKQSLYELYRSDSNFSKTSTNSVQASLKPDLSKRKNQLTSTTAYEKAIDTYEITAKIEIDGKDYAETFEIHNSRDTSDLLERVLYWLKKEFNFDGEVSELEVSLDGNILKQKQTLTDAKITENTTLKVKIPSRDLYLQLENSKPEPE